MMSEPASANPSPLRLPGAATPTGGAHAAVLAGPTLPLAAVPVNLPDTFAPASGTLTLPDAVASTTPAPTQAPSEPGWWARAWDRLGGGPGRIAGIDLARGLAVLGMIAAHTASLPELQWGVPSSWVGIAAGRSSILFATLAGVSMAIMTGGRTPYVGRQGLNARIRILVRACVLLIFGGMLQALSGYVALILEYYAIMFLLGLIFVRWPIRRLAIAIGVALPVGVMAVFYGQSLLQNLASSGLSMGGSGFWTWAVEGTYPVLAWMPFCLTGILIGRLDLTRMRTAAIICLSGLVAAGAGYGLSAAFGANDLYEASSGSVVDGGQYSAIDDGGGITPASPSSGDAGNGVTGVEPGDTGMWGGLIVEAPPSDQLVCEQDPYGGPTTCYPRDQYLEWMYDGGSGMYPGDDASMTWTWPAGADVTAKIWDSSPHSAGMMEILGSGGFAVFIIGLGLLVARGARFALFPVMAVGAMPLSAYVTHVLLIDLVAQTHWSDPWSSGVFYLIIAGSVVIAATVWRALWGRGPLERGIGWITRKASGEPAQPFAG